MAASLFELLTTLEVSVSKCLLQFWTSDAEFFRGYILIPNEIYGSYKIKHLF